MGAFLSLAALVLSVDRLARIERVVEDVGALMGTLADLQREIAALQAVPRALEEASQLGSDVQAIAS